MYPDAILNQKFYAIVIDIEVSGQLLGVHSILAVAVAVVSRCLTKDGWVVKTEQLKLFTFSQKGCVFGKSLDGSTPFWEKSKNAIVLKNLADEAEAHGMDDKQVTQQMADWIDQTMIDYDFPHIWTDHAELDLAWINYYYAKHLGREPISYVKKYQGGGLYYARRSFSIHTLAAVLVEFMDPRRTNSLDMCGTPQLMSLAMKLYRLKVLEGLVHDHNPVNDVQISAISLARLLCREYDYVHNLSYCKDRKQLQGLYNMRAITCFKYGSDIPLHAKYHAYSQPPHPNSLYASPGVYPPMFKTQVYGYTPDPRFYV